MGQCGCSFFFANWFCLKHLTAADNCLARKVQFHISKASSSTWTLFQCIADLNWFLNFFLLCKKVLWMHWHRRCSDVACAIWHYSTGIYPYRYSLHFPPRYSLYLLLQKTMLVLLHPNIHLGKFGLFGISVRLGDPGTLWAFCKSNLSKLLSWCKRYRLSHWIIQWRDQTALLGSPQQERCVLKQSFAERGEGGKPLANWVGEVLQWI